MTKAGVPAAVKPSSSSLYVRQVGRGVPVVFVHGTPSSSFEFRHVMDALAGDHRCLAPDHLGFGQSPKPPDADYRVVAHQRRFGETLDRLDLEPAIFVLHDFGTAIALPWMLAHPRRVRGVLLCNTFLWPAQGPLRWLFGFYSTAFGRWLYRVGNLSAKYLLPSAWGTAKPLDPELHAQYLAPFADRDSRYATAALPGELVGATLAEMEPQSSALGQWPVRAVWGMSDPFLGSRELDRWRQILPGLVVDTVALAGHFVAEEAPETVQRAVRALSARPNVEIQPH
ncbi:MAG: alpha/beta fold hydrolase [Myxococcales bacterium FL481]|nr:MAG: alpha/beta fold hydrolase [Myxococcales bacterium FL481]